MHHCWVWWKVWSVAALSTKVHVYIFAEGRQKQDPQGVLIFKASMFRISTFRTLTTPSCRFNKTLRQAAIHTANKSALSLTSLSYLCSYTTVVSRTWSLTSFPLLPIVSVWKHGHGRDTTTVWHWQWQHCWMTKLMKKNPFTGSWGWTFWSSLLCDLFIIPAVAESHIFSKSSTVALPWWLSLEWKMKFTSFLNCRLQTIGFFCDHVLQCFKWLIINNEKHARLGEVR